MILNTFIIRIALQLIFISIACEIMKTEMDNNIVRQKLLDIIDGVADYNIGFAILCPLFYWNNIPSKFINNK